MIIDTKSPEEIEKMRKAGKIAASVLTMIEEYVRPGITTLELNDICDEYIRSKGAISACLNYRSFPKSICTSLNDVVCHGIPNEKQKLRDGDILNIDVTVIKDGYHADTSKMYLVGDNVSLLARRLCEVTQNSLYKAIAVLKPGVSLRLVGRTIENYVRQYGYSVVRDYCGHGIGKQFHEPPVVLHFDSAENDLLLKEGMTFTIEPMVNAGKSAVRIMPDKWTVRTKDRSLSAQYEHTIAITKDGHEILTK